MKKGTLRLILGLAVLSVIIALLMAPSPVRDRLRGDQTGEQWGLFLIAIALLAVAVSIAAAVYSWLDLADPSQPLGLPTGSVRAIIAIMLILLFAMMSQFLFEDVGTILLSKQIQMTQAQLDRVPVENIFSAAQQPDDNFLVLLRLDNSTRDDLARQILTTLSTLIVSLAGFYFGTRAVAIAQGRAVDAEIELTPTPATLAMTVASAQVVEVASSVPGTSLLAVSDAPTVAAVTQLAIGSFRVDAKTAGTAMITFTASGAPEFNATVPVTVT